MFYEQYSQKLKMEAEPDIMEDFKLAAMEGRIGGKSTLMGFVVNISTEL